jgi:hypothetical protein
MAWPFTPLTTYIPNSLPAISANDLNKIQAFINGFVALHDAEVFGPGTSGNVFLSTTSSLTQDLYCTNLVVNSGGKLITNGYAIYASQSVTVASGGWIAGDGQSAAGTTPGIWTGPHGCPGLSPITGSTGSGGSTPFLGLGGAGVAGGNGNNGSATTGSVGPFPQFGAGCYTMPPYRLGQLPRSYNTSLLGNTRVPVACDFLMGGAGGGAGGGDGTNFGGAGGAGGALVVIITPTLLIQSTGVISATGGNGGSPTAGNCGGGAGGSGGAFLFVVRSYTNSGGLAATGGNGAAGHGTGTAGTAGNIGVSTPYLVTLPSWPT